MKKISLAVFIALLVSSCGVRSGHSPTMNSRGITKVIALNESEYIKVTHSDKVVISFTASQSEVKELIKQWKENPLLSLYGNVTWQGGTAKAKFIPRHGVHGKGEIAANDGMIFKVNVARN